MSHSRQKSLTRYSEEKEEAVVPLLTHDPFVHRTQPSTRRRWLLLLPSVLVFVVLCYSIQDDVATKLVDWSSALRDSVSANDASLPPPYIHLPEESVDSLDGVQLIQQLEPTATFKQDEDLVDDVGAMEDLDIATSTEPSTPIAEETDSPVEGEEEEELEIPTSIPLQVLPQPTPTTLIPVIKQKTPEQLDLEVCGESPCRLFLAARIGEGESKAHVHIVQTAILAQSLNRTLVLPNMRDGLMNMCYPHPFDFYFDLDWFKTTFGIQVMLYNRYEEWVHERTKLAKTPPTGQYLLASNADSNDGEIDILRTPISIPAMKLFCYRQAMLDYKPWSPVTMIPPKAYRYGSGGAVAEAYGHYVSETLNSPEWILSTSMIDNNPEAEPQVIVADWHFSVAVWRMPGAKNTAIDSYRLQYNARWRDLAEQEAARLSPYIAVHWRMETVPAKNLMSCGQNLHKVLASMHEKYPEIKDVFLLTDYPIESLDHPHSLTFMRAMTEVHTQAVNYFTSHFAEATHGLRLTTLMQEIPTVKSADSNEDISLLDLDVGLVGVMDRALAKRATYFVAGEPSVCGRRSSMTAQIVAARRVKMAEHNDHILNDVEHFYLHTQQA